MVVSNVLDNLIDEEVAITERLGRQPQFYDSVGYSVSGVYGYPCIDAVGQEMAAHDVLGSQEAPRRSHLAFHHLHWLCKVIHVVRLVPMCIV